MEMKSYNFNSIPKDILEKFKPPSVFPFKPFFDKVFANWQKMDVNGKEIELIEYLFPNSDESEVIRYHVREFIDKLDKKAKKLNIDGKEIFYVTAKKGVRLIWFNSDSTTHYLTFLSDNFINTEEKLQTLIEGYKSI